MASVVRRLFWSEGFWLPTNLTWEDFNSTNSNVYIPQAQDLILSIILGVVFAVMRTFYERYIVIPIAISLGVKSKRHQAKHNPILEKWYSTHGAKYDETAITAVLKQTDWERRQVERWVRVKVAQNKNTDLGKFSDVAFHFLAYSLASIYGLVVLWDKSWFAETKHSWIGWPNQHLSAGIFWYYQCELGLYWCLVFRVMIDHRRKDFVENVVHHVTTMLLVSFSYVMNFVRIGSLIFIIHDVVDPWLSLAKMAKYAKRETLCLYLFIIFVIIWMITRTGIYPFVALYSCTYEVSDNLHGCPFYLLFLGLLYTLLVLHLMWTYSILRIAYINITHGEIDDVRSDSDDAYNTDSDSQEVSKVPIN